MWFGRSSPAPSRSDYEQITNFATPRRLLRFPPMADGGVHSRGDAVSYPFGPNYVKQLPNGEAVQLTNDPRPKLAPAFTPDGARVAYTLRESGAVEGWNTWTVPVSGGQPTRMLPNAAALTWIDDPTFSFPRSREQHHSHGAEDFDAESRGRALGLCAGARARHGALFLHLPDRASVLVVEMAATGAWAPCRLVPFDGSSAGRQVGPAGECRSAAWSPDGRWMYFSALVDGVSHLWRQRFPNGTPEPLTSGSATEEEGVAVAPDGASLITSLGRRQSSIWLHDPRGERLLSAEGFAVDPSLSADGARVYYLLRRTSTSGTVELTMVDIATGRTDRLLPDFSVLDYDISSSSDRSCSRQPGAAESARSGWRRSTAARHHERLRDRQIRPYSSTRGRSCSGRSRGT